MQCTNTHSDTQLEIKNNKEPIYKDTKYKNLKFEEERVSDMAQQVKRPAVNPDNLSPVPRTHMEEAKTLSLLTSTCILWHAVAPTHIHSCT